MLIHAESLAASTLQNDGNPNRRSSSPRPSPCIVGSSTSVDPQEAPDIDSGV